MFLWQKNLLKPIRLKRHFKLCFLKIWSCNTNTVPRITKHTQILFIISFKQKSMMILHWEIITNALLVVLPYQRFTIMWRVMKKVMGLKTNTRNLVNLIKANATVRTWPKVKAKAKARHLHAINVVVQTILLENVEPLNIWLSYTKNLWRSPTTIKDRMKLTSTIWPRWLPLREQYLQTPICPRWQTLTICTWGTRSWSTTPTMCLETSNRLIHLLNRYLLSMGLCVTPRSEK
jgi:hypothetical protein